MSGNGAAPDPVSIPWEAAAAQIVERARAARGQWYGTRLADPTPRQVARYLAIGIDVRGPDPVKHRLARGRWQRAFVRAFYRQVDRRSFEVEIGRKYPQRGVIPAGRYVRVRQKRGGSVAMRAVKRKPDADRIYLDDGTPGGRFADPAARDWDWIG